MVHETLETMIVAEVMNRWPETVPVFVRRRMACPGCVMAPFMTVAEASKEYGVKASAFAAELAAEIGRTKPVADDN
jgi:hybrid cluster-associated redox disulfide protein